MSVNHLALYKRRGQHSWPTAKTRDWLSRLQALSSQLTLDIFKHSLSAFLDEEGSPISSGVRQRAFWPYYLWAAGMARIRAFTNNAGMRSVFENY
jgi:hypothetical protein